MSYAGHKTVLDQNPSFWCLEGGGRSSPVAYWTSDHWVDSYNPRVDMFSH